MSAQSDTDSRLEDYLEEGPAVLPDWVLNSVREEVHRHPDQIGRRPWRTRSMPPYFAAGAAVAIILIGAVALMQFTRQSDVGSGVPRDPDGPFVSGDVQALGLLPGDIPGLGYTGGTRVDEGERANADAVWLAHLSDHGLAGRWVAQLVDPEARLTVGSYVSIWSSDKDASAALAFENGWDGRRVFGPEISVLTSVEGLGEEGGCAMLPPGAWGQWKESFCRFRVRNATIDLYGQARQGTPYPLAELEGVAHLIAARAEELAAAPGEVGPRHTITGEVIVRDGEPILRQDVAIGCRSTESDSDIRNGMPVYVHDKSTDEVLARGALVVGEPPVIGDGCAFHFAVPLVPDAEMYSIRLDGRDVGLTYTREALERREWTVETMELGR